MKQPDSPLDSPGDGASEMPEKMLAIGIVLFAALMGFCLGVIVGKLL